jgi:putative hemolysin
VLRFVVFNLELNEGLEESYRTCLDADCFDAVCDHLIVEDIADASIVGTYRMQTGTRAARAHGYYSAREFDFAPFEPLRAEILELGRACIHSAHRNFAVLSLLWRGLVAHATQNGARYLIGCSSLTSRDPAVGLAAHALLQRHLVGPELRTVPLPEFACEGTAPAATAPKLPKLLAAYLALGARICGPPAIDREFGTIDFLTLMDLAALDPRLLRRWGAVAG